MGKAISGFGNPGISPFNRDTFGDHDLAALTIRDENLVTIPFSYSISYPFNPNMPFNFKHRQTFNLRHRRPIYLKQVPQTIKSTPDG